MFLLKIPTTEILYRDHKAHHPAGKGKGVEEAVPGVTEWLLP